MKKKIAVLTGAGVSAESGISTFRDAGGLWENYPVEQVASIDGYERNPELVICFYNGLRRKLLEALPNEGHRLVAKLEEKYINYNDEINRKPLTVHKLVLSLADKDFFEGILNNRVVTPTRDSHDKIKKANQLLGNFVKEKLDQCAVDTEKIDMLAKIEHALQSNCTVIFMDCDSRDSAYKLFQVLNDRGAGLNEGDLLKSKTLEVLEHFPEEQEQVQKCWDEILEEEPSKVESFLRTYYASCCGKRAGNYTERSGGGNTHPRRRFRGGSASQDSCGY